MKAACDEIRVVFAWLGLGLCLVVLASSSCGGDSVYASIRVGGADPLPEDDDMDDDFMRMQVVQFVCDN